MASFQRYLVAPLWVLVARIIVQGFHRRESGMDLEIFARTADLSALLAGARGCGSRPHRRGVRGRFLGSGARLGRSACPGTGRGLRRATADIAGRSGT